MIAILVIVLALPFIFIRETTNILMTLIKTNFILSSIVYVSMVILSVVLAPFNLPLFYIAGAIWGPERAIIYNMFGWSVGAALAFQIARRAGRPFLSRFVNMKKIDTYAHTINPNIEFLGVIVLRVVMPVDVLSYALGLFSKISFIKYMIATVIGIIPFTIIFAYGGHSLLEGNYFLSIFVLVMVVLAIAIATYILKKKRK